MTESGSSVCEGEATGNFSRPHLIYNDTETGSLGVKHKNVILFGGNNAEKRSLINFMAGRSVAKPSPDPVGTHTPQGRAYSFTLLGGDTQMSLRLIDTVGIEESELDTHGLTGVTEGVQRLLTLKKADGIDLLLFCVKAGRFNASMQQNYHLFSEILCGGRVPLALVLTHLEDEDVMEHYWERNRTMFKKYGLDPVAHAWIPADPTHVIVHADPRVEDSKLALYELFHGALCDRTSCTASSSAIQDIRERLSIIIEKSFSFLMRRMKMKEVAMKLETRCILPRGEAQKIAELIVKG